MKLYGRDVSRGIKSFWPSAVLGVKGHCIKITRDAESLSVRLVYTALLEHFNRATY